MIPHFYLRISFVASAILFVLTISSFIIFQHLTPSSTGTAGTAYTDQPETVVSNQYPVKVLVDMVAPHHNTSTTTKTILRLRHDWNYHPPQSHLAQLIHAHQTNCSNTKIATYYSDNNYGMGSHVAVWSQGICQAMQQHRRLQTRNPIWLWLDQSKCDMTIQAQQSPWSCYFPMAEPFCPQLLQQQQHPETPTVNLSIPRDHKRHSCHFFAKGDTSQLQAFRAASTEVLFQRVSLVVIAEAERQLGLLFGEKHPPEDLITVHIRWGDKFWEMDLASIQEYLQAISNILIHHQGKQDNLTANIYLATEDPRAAQEFQTAIPPGWKVYYDLTIAELSTYRPPKGNRASHMARNTHGRAGLVGLGSLLLAMEAKWFVLTTASNWSRMMDHLRTQIINPRCNNCTVMVDLRPGIW